MNELLTYVVQQIEQLSKVELNTIDENWNDIECYDGEAIFDDGEVSGKLAAYWDIRKRLHEHLNTQDELIE